ncbi:hypothetical protein [Thalassovita sp.]|uniref:hypothetical protein n=1 Tax=Thalassovita sp. TaxID=1979401 RepID=UPI002AB2B011|nr:hypothetical protein [Thalassovita sp.]
MDSITAISATDIYRDLRAAGAILEWLNIAHEDAVIDLCLNSFDATLSSNETTLEFSLGKVSAQSTLCPVGAVLNWCNFVLESNLRDKEALTRFCTAFAMCHPDQLQILTLHCAKSGIGAITPPRVGQTHLFEIGMFDVIGRGDSEAAAVLDWLTAAGAHVRQPWHFLKAAA